MYANTTGSSNTAVGGGNATTNATMRFNTTGSYNTAIGIGSLGANTTANNNTAVGYQCLYANTTGADNTAVGRLAANANTTGASNVAMGNSALVYNTTGSYNVAIGQTALTNNTTGNYNTAVGFEALYSTAGAGNNNVAVGYGAGYSNVIGDESVYIGYNAGQAATAGGNIVIGSQAATSAAGTGFQIVIGYGVVGQGQDYVTFGRGGVGKIYNQYGVNATWTQTSDGRLKTNIQPDSLGLSFINRLNPVTFTWKPSNELEKGSPYYAEENKRNTTTVIHGLIAQEVKAAMEAEGCTTFNGWDEGEDGVQAISREMFITPLINAIKELKAEVDSLKAQLNK
jgi:hypothetical protein